MIKKQPVLFIAHGSPMNAIIENSYSKSLNKLGEELDKPKAIMIISAHWYINNTFLTKQDSPKEIYDFYGFPEELYKVKYSTSGAKPYINLAFEELKNYDVKLTDTWGLDHGGWSVLKHIFPKADIPVFELSLNALEKEEYHYNLGKKLSKLREQGILILASGNIVHNLGKMKYNEEDKPYKWALDFDNFVRDAIINDEHDKLINYKDFGQDALASVPTNEHFLPLLYVLALKEDEDKVEFIFDEIHHGSLSMRSIKIG
ncbi:4,5-DOPA dioxygenase extradiol [Clostridium gasigenes]|uniref:Aromatic ring-opening dioxygenase, catalytic subunit, LigB family n=1 Tax=Clostridium gasigenes TaxID=94869 RepID=A0A1H0LDR5_9CLOT|nr:4,5-DOPA dioxygenase extradiol [Clostridium gasigenes]MBU3087290.1 4,5-DOPA dioxygenase extradiol [Clostridium gasigenes]SDO66153.1 Aromatic ring-opening dioxygenase, catalytic subunit, LigB family [Clostridium gasigenes]